jgi:hypothetical protein
MTFRVAGLVILPTDAAQRFFGRAGIFLQHMIQNGRNRDTAWYSMLDGEWPSYKAAYEQWLLP